jgi:Ring finger domain
MWRCSHEAAAAVLPRIERVLKPALPPARADVLDSPASYTSKRPGNILATVTVLLSLQTRLKLLQLLLLCPSSSHCARLKSNLVAKIVNRFSTFARPTSSFAPSKFLLPDFLARRKSPQMAEEKKDVQRKINSKMESAKDPSNSWEYTCRCEKQAQELARIVGLPEPSRTEEEKKAVIQRNIDSKMESAKDPSNSWEYTCRCEKKAQELARIVGLPEPSRTEEEKKAVIQRSHVEVRNATPSHLPPVGPNRILGHPQAHDSREFFDAEMDADDLFGIVLIQRRTRLGIPTESLLMGEIDIGNAPGPANPQDVAALPKIMVDKNMLGDDDKAQCSICMEEVHIGEEVTLLWCSHWFHRPCVTAWLNEHDTCPHCRKGIVQAREAQRRATDSRSAPQLH